MSIRKILTEPDPFLRQKSKNVDEVDDQIRILMNDMLDTMYDAPGIGLAAIQVGVPKRVFVIDLSKDGEKKQPLFFVNPEIISNSNKDATYEEGTVVMFGGEAEVTSAQGYGSTKIAGVVSTKPAFAMNSEAGSSETHPFIALQGRVPCKVVGTVSKGDILVASDISGVATVWTESTVDPRMTAYVGIAIEDKNTDGAGYVEVKVGK